MKLAIAFALAMSAFAQDLPSRVAFLGTGWTARQASPTTGFAGIAIKLTDSVGGVYSWNSVIATAQTNSFATGIAKPVYKIGPVTPWIVSSGGIAAGNGTYGFTYGGGVLLSAQTADLFALLKLPFKPKGTIFAGAQVNQINGGSGIPYAGVNLSPGFGFAIPWGN